MANPNIVSVTSIYGESIGEALTTTVGPDIMTVRIHNLVKINSIIVTNTHATNAVAVTVKIVKAGFTSAGIGASEDNAGTFALASTMNLPADDSLVLVDKPIYLMEADVLRGGASAASTLELFASYEVINDA